LPFPLNYMVLLMPTIYQNKIDRILLLDAARGFAVLGVLWVNIYFFAMPYSIIAMPDVWGDVSNWSYISRFLVDVFGSGVMRGMLSVIFGATAIMMLDRINGSAQPVAEIDRYFKRLMVLIVFGLIHSYILLWPFDILYVYGLLGLFIFPLRSLSIGALRKIAATMFVLSMIAGGLQFGPNVDLSSTETKDLSLEQEVISPEISDPEAEVLTEEFFAQAEEELTTHMADVEIEILTRRSGYFTNFVAFFDLSFEEQTTEILKTQILDVGTFIIIGIILFKTGFLTCQLATSTYVKIALGGFLCGICFGYISMVHGVENDADYMSTQLAFSYLYDPRRLGFVLGNLAILAIFIKTGFALSFIRRLADCGKMALSLYISQTIICNFLFMGYGLGLFAGYVHFEVTMFVVILVLIQYFAASAYLRVFGQGPLEILMGKFLSKGKRLLPTTHREIPVPVGK
jgi:uncharacterized protein